VSSNTPNQPGDSSNQENAPPFESQSGGRDPLANNPYSAQYHQRAVPDLDAGAPVLRSHDLVRMNRRALVFLVIIVAMLAMLGFWLMQSGSNRNAAPKAKPETIVIPEAPQVPLLPPQTPVRRMQVQPAIPLVTAPALPTRAPIQPMQVPHRPSLLQRRIDDSNDDTGSGGGTSSVASNLLGGGNPAQSSAVTAGLQVPGMPSENVVRDTPTSAQPLNDPDTLMAQGTFIRCVLQTRIITDYPGFASCIVTEPVYSFTGRRLLLPKGSKVIGKYGTGPTSSRVAVIWDRIVTPNGIDIDMRSPGVDDLGGTGYEGYVDSHWPSRISAALLVSILSDAFSYEAAEHGPRTASVTNGVVVETPFQSNTASTLQQLAGQAVRRAADRAPTITINQGTIVDIYVSKDVDFSGVVSRF
jgi:type IV secretion system protein VirB10